MSPRYGATDLTITGLGMVTAVGQDAKTACASMRAGITRPAELPSWITLDETHEESCLIGHPVQDCSEGFRIVGAWLRLAVACLDDLIASASLPEPTDTSFWSRTGLLVVVPELSQERFGDGADDFNALENAYLHRLVALTGLDLSPAPRAFAGKGHAGALTSLMQVQTAIDSGRVDRVIVVGADSYLDDLSLNWLDATNRLKTIKNPVGLAPGEGGACILVESRSAADRRRARVEAIVLAVATDQETESYARGKLSKGRALGRAMRRCLTESAATLPFTGDIVSDLNGEIWRAHDFGSARVHAAGVLNGAAMICAAATLGDTGAASGVIALCVAARSLQRRYARSRHVLVTASSTDGEVGAAVLSGDENMA